jgi:Protein of unknown function (DUF2934)
MPSRRSPDSKQPARPAPPPAAPLDAKLATKPPVAAVKKSKKPVAANAATKPTKRRPSAPKKHSTAGARGATGVSVDERRGMIAKAAYLRGESRGFPPGGEPEDWLAAEQEIDALLGGVSGAAQ